MKIVLFLIGFSILSFISNAQEAKTTIKLEKKLDNNVKDWTTLNSPSEIQIDYKFNNCDPTIGYDVEKVLLQFTNKTDKTIQIKWHLILYYNEICKTCDYPQEYTFELTLGPNEILSGNCSLESDHKLTLFSKFLDERYKVKNELTSFELKDFEIITAN